MKLTSDEQAMADGRDGEAVALAMHVMRRLGEIYDAEDMVAIEGAHIDGCLFRGEEDAALLFAERLAAAGARVRVPTTLSAGSRDIARWRELRVDAAFAAGCERMEQAYLSMGTLPAWTCAPYLHDQVPGFGQHVAWAESNAICYANSVLGARTARYGDFADICAAIIGRVPRFDLHLAENRYGQVLVRCRPDLIGSDDNDSALIGYALGKLAGDRIPVIDGLPTSMTSDQLKALSAAAATSGNVALFHIIGITPEAPTREQAFGGKPPEEEVDLGPAEIDAARAALSVEAPNGGGDDAVDLVAIGCPHASFTEVAAVAGQLRGKAVAGGVELWVKTNRAVIARLEQQDLLAPLLDAGAKVIADACIFPPHYERRWGFRRVVTNSAKFAHYAANGMRVQPAVRTLAGCVDAAVSGLLGTPE